MFDNGLRVNWQYPNWIKTKAEQDKQHSFQHLEIENEEVVKTIRKRNITNELENRVRKGSKRTTTVKLRRIKCERKRTRRPSWLSRQFSGCVILFREWRWWDVWEKRRE